VSLSWTGPEPERLPPLTLREQGRFWVRAAVAVAGTVLFVLVFLAARGVDLGLKAIWRRHLPALAPWVVHLWGRFGLAAAGVAYRQVGRPMEHPGALVANHASWLDIVALMRATRVFFVSKSEVAAWPAIGWVAKAIGTMFIERKAAEARRQRDVLFARLMRGDRLAIFPEGTSTDGRRVLRFKSTLFEVFFAPELREAVWVQPVSLIYHAPEGLPPAFFGWWGDADFFESARDVLARGAGGSVELVFHAPLRVADFAGRKPLAEAAEAMVRGAVAARVGGG
jgi:1-acyl-sn-glycerol-3-phosphate acyltransferase